MKKFLSIFVLFFSVLAVVGCGILPPAGGDTFSRKESVAREELQACFDRVFFEEKDLVISSDLDLPTETKLAEKITYEWTSSNPDVISAEGKVTRPEVGQPNAEVTLSVKMTAEYTIKDDGSRVPGFVEMSNSWTFTVLAKVPTNLTTIAEMKAQWVANGKPGKADGMNVEFEGVVTSKLAAGYPDRYFVNDGTDGIYVFCEEKEINVGDKVRVTGTMDVHYDVAQVVNVDGSYSVEVIEKGCEMPAPVETTVDAIEKAAEADGLYGGRLYKVYAKYEKAEGTDGTSTYVNHYLTDPNNGEQLLVYYQTAFVHAPGGGNAETYADILAPYEGKYINITVVTYDRKDNISRVCLSSLPIEEAEKPSLGDADKLALVAAKISNMQKEYNPGDVLVLPTENAEYGATISWSVAENTVINPETGVVLDAGQNTVVKLTATVSVGSLTQEVVVEITALTLKPIKTTEAAEAADGTKVVILGVVKSIEEPWSSYNNNSFTLADEAGTMYVFRTGVQVALGDYVKVTGEMATYNGSRQIAKGAAVEILGHKVTIAEACAAADETVLVVEATVKSIDTEWNEKYGNITVTLEDATGTISAYRLATNVEEGDKVLVYGTKTTYTKEGVSTIQFAAGAEAAILEKASTETPEPSEELVSYEFVEKAMPEGLTYIPNNPEHPDPGFYSAGLKMNYENMGVLTSKFAPQAKVTVKFTIAALNQNTKTGTDTDDFVVTGLNEKGETVATAKLAEGVKGENVVVLEGEGIVQVQIIMTSFVFDGTKYCNVNLSKVVVVAGESNTETEPPHEHVFVEGTCECGEKDPNYSAPELPSTPGTVVYVVKDHGFENSKAYSEVAIDGNITATFTGTPVGDYGLNTGKYYNTGEGFRIYQNESPQFTIAVKEGYVIEKVTITYTVTNTGVLTLDNSNVESGTEVEVNGTNVTFSVGNTGDKTNGQVRISVITVVYKAA